MAAFTRRQALITGGSALLAAACTTTEPEPTPQQPLPTHSGDLRQLLDRAGTCTLTPQQTEGPYHLDLDSVRTDIREDRPGARLRVALRVQDLPGCTPVPDAMVEIWHADAGGVYSGFESARSERFLRGSQPTDTDGIAEFTTIYPGWYRGRTVHIHFKVHLGEDAELTGQLYFDDRISAAVFGKPPYTNRSGRDRGNDADSLFDEKLVMMTVPDGDGYLAAMTVGVDRG